jgi:hypothetical protein
VEVEGHAIAGAPLGLLVVYAYRVMVPRAENMQRKSERLTGFRRLATVLWDEPADPQIYGAIDIDASALIAFTKQVNGGGAHVTPTHLVGRAIGRALTEVPALNVRLFRGRAVPRAGIDVFFIAAIKAGKDLSGVKILNIDTKSARQVAMELALEAQRLRVGQDSHLARAKAMFERLPRPLARAVLRLAAWAAGDAAWDIPALGVSATPFGSAMVSSVGMFGLPMGFAPIAWMYRVPLLILVGEIAERPLVVDGTVQVRPVLPLCATIDHRYVDGAELGRALAALKDYLLHPCNYESEPASQVPPDGASSDAPKRPG